MRIGVMVAVISLMSALPAAAFADSAQAQDASQSPANNPDEIVCKITAPPTGTRLGGGRECHTQREWDQRTKDSQAALLRQQQSVSGGIPGQ